MNIRDDDGLPRLENAMETAEWCKLENGDLATQEVGTLRKKRSFGMTLGLRSRDFDSSASLKRTRVALFTNTSSAIYQYGTVQNPKRMEHLSKK